MNPNIAFFPDWFLNFVLKRVVNVVVGKLTDKEYYQKEKVRKAIQDKKDNWAYLLKNFKKPTQS